MDSERFNSAYRLGLAIALAYVLWLLVPAVWNYAQLVITTAQYSRQTSAAQRPKLTAGDLETALRQEKQFANSQLRCEPGNRDWDYVCSYQPTPRQSETRLQFGVIVDAKRWVQLSAVVPAGTILPQTQAVSRRP